MFDRESVITHLQIIHTWAEFARKRDLQFFTEKHLEDIAQWSDDAIELLKEQEDLGTELTNAVELIHKKNERIEKLLKEQKVVEPKQVDLYGKDEWYGLVCVCPDCKTEWMSDKADTHFCPKCGRSVKWE